MSTLNDNDLFAYQEAATGNVGAVANNNRSNLEDDDLFVVYRPSTGLNYKVQASDVGGGAKLPPNVTDVALTQVGLPNENRFTNNSFISTITNTGGDAATTEMTGKIVGALGIKVGTDPIQSNNYTGTASGTSVPLTLTGNTNLNQASGIEVGDTVTASASYTPETDTITSVSGFQAVGTWSKVSGADSSTPNEPLAGFNNIWNDNPNSKAYFNYTNTASQTSRYKFTFASPIPFTKLEAYVGAYDGSSLAWVSFNGGAAIRGGTNTGTPVRVEFTDNANAAPGATPGLLESFEIGTNGANYGYIGQILVDEVPLTDSIKTLSFSIEKDIKLFQAGDVVQEENAPWNNKTTWSDTIVATNSAGGQIDATEMSRAFDTDLTNAARGVATFTLDDIGITNVTKLEIYMTCAAQTITVNINDTGDETISHSGGYAHITPTLPSDSINKIVFRLTTSNCDLNYIRATTNTGLRYFLNPGETQSGTTEVKVLATDVAAKTITVDGGSWDTSNQSQVWSNSLTGTGLSDAAKAFDGNKDSFADTTEGWSLDLSGYTFGSGSHTVEIKSGGATSITVNGTAGLTDPGGSGPKIWTGTYNGEINTIASSATGASFYYLEIDGQILVDTGVRDLGDSKVSSVYFKQGSGTVSGIVGNVVTVFPYTDNCFKEGQWLTVNKTINVSPKTDAIDDYVSATKTLTFDGPKDLAQFASGDAVYMCDSNGTAASYTATTSTITNVGRKYSGSADVQPSTAGSWEQVLDGVACQVPATCGMDTNSQTTWTFDNAITVTAQDTFEIFNSGAASYPNIVGWSYDNAPDNFTYVSGGNGIHSSGWAWDTLPVVGDLKKLRVGTSPGFGITAYRLNGVILDSTEVTLTFTDDTNLKYYAQGDAVQGTDNYAYTEWLGNDTAGTVINTGVNNSGKALLWSKSRDDGRNHNFTSTADSEKYLLCPSLNGYSNYGAGNGIDFTSTGVVLNNSSPVNHPGETFSSWNFAAQPGFFDVLTWSGDGNNNMDIPHNLQGVPAFAIVKTTNKNNNFQVYHKEMGSNASMSLNTNSGKDDGGYWGTMTSTTFGATQYVGHTQIGYDQVAYVWAETPGVTKMGKYTGSGSPSGSYANKVDVGFKPAWVMIKGLAGNTDWDIFSREMDQMYLVANKPDGKLNGNQYFQWTDTGFGVSGSATNLDQAGVEYIYIAISESVLVESVDVANNQMVVNGGSWNNGGTVSQDISGTGTVSSANVSTNSMVLSASNDKWVENYYAATATKPAVATTAYLKFDANGQISGYQATPVNAVSMVNTVNPTLSFPTEFADTGTTPDEEFSDTSAYLQTSVKLTNTEGDSSKDSNPLVPSTTTFFGAQSGEVKTNQTEFVQMLGNVNTKDLRQATKTLIDAEETVDESRTKAQQLINNYISNG